MTTTATFSLYFAHAKYRNHPGVRVKTLLTIERPAPGTPEQARRLYRFLRKMGLDMIDARYAVVSGMTAFGKLVSCPA